VYSRDYLQRVGQAIRGLGTERAIVVCGRDGLDEISTMEATDAVLIEEDRLDAFVIDPASLGLMPPALGDLAGGGPDDNARILVRAIGGAAGPVRDILVVNAAAALWMAGIASSLQDGMARAEEAATSGAAKDVLERFINTTGRLAPAA
jgi:anthranilate phosphoribosyltransferase